MKKVLALNQNEGNPDAAVFCAYHNAYVLQKKHHNSLVQGPHPESI